MRALLGNPNLPGVADGSLVAHGEFVAPFGAAAGKHGAPVLCLHARPEPMRFGPLAIVRLKCTFRHWGCPAVTLPDAKLRPETITSIAATPVLVRRQRSRPEHISLSNVSVIMERAGIAGHQEERS